MESSRRREDPKAAPMEPSQAWGALQNVLETHFYRPDLEAVRAIYSAVASQRLPGPPVWPMLVGPPGSMKTELLMALVGLPHAIAQRAAAARGLSRRPRPHGRMASSAGVRKGSGNKLKTKKGAK